jgi:predicted nucleic acid-binding protein
VTNAKRQTVHLFIDTNIFLNFFAYSKDDLDQLQKLVELLRVRRVKLYLTQQVVDEFYRNRETKLAESLAGFNQWKATTCPSFMLPLEEYDDYKTQAKLFEKAHRALLAKAKADAESNTLLADDIFLELRKIATLIPTEPKNYEAALQRFNLGNPPGKGTGVGDQLNWELLLQHVPGENDLHVLTKDGDYTSKLTPTVAKRFLEDEWLAKKSGNILIYEQLNQFFKKNFPENDFSLDIEKREAIDYLVGSGSFASTHSAVSLLSPYVGFFTDEEVEEIIQAALTNPQVGWIMTDPDVQAFFTRMLEEYKDSIPAKLKSKIEESLSVP